MTVQRQLCPGMALQKPWRARGWVSFHRGLPMGTVPVCWGISAPSPWPSPAWRGWHGPKVAWQGRSVTMATSTPRDEAWPWGGPAEPTGLLSPPRHPLRSTHLGAAVVLGFGAPPTASGQGAPGEGDAVPWKGLLLVFPIHALCPVSSHPPPPLPQVIANLHLSRLLQVPPAALLLCLSHSREQCWRGGNNAWPPPLGQTPRWGGWLAVRGGSPILQAPSSSSLRSLQLPGDKELGWCGLQDPDGRAGFAHDARRGVSCGEQAFLAFFFFFPGNFNFFLCHCCFQTAEIRRSRSPCRSLHASNLQQIVSGCCYFTYTAA